MGHVEVKVALANPKAGIAFEEKGLVYTGATLTVLPRKIAEALHLDTTSKSKAMTAGGPITVELSDLQIEIAGKTGTVKVAISDVVDRLLVGVTTLETLGLAVDPLSGQLKESFYLMY